MEHTVRNIISTGKAWGVTWWDGVLDRQNKPRPMGRKFAQLAAEFKRARPEIAARKTAIVIPDRGLSTKPSPPDWKYAQPYMNLINRGLSPAIVLESRSKDEDYLRARGITELIESSG